MNKQQKNTPAAVDYTPVESAAEARKRAISLGRQWSGLEKKGESLTVLSVFATRDALRTGYLRDGRDAAETVGGVKTVNKGGFAEVMGQKGQTRVSLWITLAGAVDKGIVPGHPLWDILATGTHVAAKNSEVAKVLRDKGAKVADVQKVLASERIGPDGAKMKDSAPRNTQKDEPDKEASGGEQPLSPVDAALTALKTVAEACKQPTVQGEEYDIIRRAMLRILTAEDKRRGITRTPAGAKGKAPAAPEAAKVAS